MNKITTVLSIAAVAGIMMATLLTITTSMSMAWAQGKAHPPIGLFGNPHDFRPGPPIPSCNADFNQGPPNDLLKGCRETP